MCLFAFVYSGGHALWSIANSTSASVSMDPILKHLISDVVFCAGISVLIIIIPLLIYMIAIPVFKGFGKLIDEYGIVFYSFGAGLFVYSILIIFLLTMFLWFNKFCGVFLYGNFNFWCIISGIFCIIIVFNILYKGLSEIQELSMLGIYVSLILPTGMFVIFFHYFPKISVYIQSIIPKFNI